MGQLPLLEVLESVPTPLHLIPVQGLDFEVAFVWSEATIRPATAREAPFRKAIKCLTPSNAAEVLVGSHYRTPMNKSPHTLAAYWPFV